MDYEPDFADRDNEAGRLSGCFTARQGPSISLELEFGLPCPLL